MEGTRLTRLSDGQQLVDLPSGTRLECHVSLAPASAHTADELDDADQGKLAVCLHPWAWLGGRMEDPVLQTIVSPLHAQGYDVLRYNSRGVGQSTGRSSWTGKSEAQDLQELIQWAVMSMSSVRSLVLVGYSYGSLIVSLHPVLPDTRTSHVLLSYPLSPRHWLTAFHGRHYTNALNTLLSDPRADVLVVYGDADNFTSVEEYDAWADGLSQQADGRGKLEIVRIADANHFWRGPDATTRLVQAVECWLL